MRTSLSLALALAVLGCAAPSPSPAPAAPPVKTLTSDLGNFCICLAVKDLSASRAFYEKLGFKVVSGDAKQNWQVLSSGPTKIGLFQGILEKHTLTFNPGWDPEGKPLASFTDVRELQRRFEAAGLKPDPRAEGGDGPAYFILADPDGNPIFFDQHVPRAK